MMQPVEAVSFSHGLCQHNKQSSAGCKWIRVILRPLFVWTFSRLSFFRGSFFFHRYKNRYCSAPSDHRKNFLSQLPLLLLKGKGRLNPFSLSFFFFRTPNRFFFFLQRVKRACAITVAFGPLFTTSYGTSYVTVISIAGEDDILMTGVILFSWTTEELYGWPSRRPAAADGCTGKGEDSAENTLYGIKVVKPECRRSWRLHQGPPHRERCWGFSTPSTPPHPTPLPNHTHTLLATWCVRCFFPENLRIHSRRRNAHKYIKILCIQNACPWTLL